MTVTRNGKQRFKLHFDTDTKSLSNNTPMPSFLKGILYVQSVKKNAAQNSQKQRTNSVN